MAIGVIEGLSGADWVDVKFDDNFDATFVVNFDVNYDLNFDDNFDVSFDVNFDVNFPRSKLTAPPLPWPTMAATD